MSSAQAATTPSRPRAVIYLRVSTKDQAERGGEVEGFSIPAQREACLRKAESLGAECVGEYVDAGESARSANRPQLQQMLQRVDADTISFVIVHKVDRLARNRADDIEINLAIRKAGTTLVSCSENIDETPSGQLMHGIMSSISEFYSLNLSAEAKKGMLQKAKNGGTPGRAPFGYKNVIYRDEVGREVRTVEVDTERAPWVKRVYELYCTGEWTTQMIAEELRKHEVGRLPTPKFPSRPIAVSQIQTILTNRYYVGIVKHAGAEFAGRHEPLISEETFAEAQAIREGRVASNEKPRVHVHYLKGSLFCGDCGEALGYGLSRGRLGVLYEYFWCYGRKSGRTTCNLRALPAALVEGLVEDHWLSQRLTAQDVAAIREIVMPFIEQLLPYQDEMRRQAETRLSALDAAAKKLIAAHLADALELDDLKREQAVIAAERAHLRSTMTAGQLSRERILSALSQVFELLENGHDFYIAADDQSRRDLNQAYFSRIFLYDDEVIGSDLSPVIQMLLSDDLAGVVRRERKAMLAGHRQTPDHLAGPDGTESASSAFLHPRGDLRPHDRVSAVQGAYRPSLRRERPRGPFRWEQKRPAPGARDELKDRLMVGGLTETILVGAEGIEPPTASL